METDNTKSPPESCSLILTISLARGVLYANTAFCDYVGLSIEQVVGRNPQEFSALTSGEVAEFFAEFGNLATPNRLFADASGRVFEVKISSRQGITDLIFDEVTATAHIQDLLAPVSGIVFEELQEDELRTVRIPDLRFVTGCAARMKNSAGAAGKISPLEHRVIAAMFLEETSEALLAHGCTVLPPMGGLAMGFAGAPRYHVDHSLRALESAFELAWRMERVRENCETDGRSVPAVGCGVASGNAIVGGFGGGKTLAYLADGDCVEIAERLSRIAAGGEVLVTATSLEHLLSNLPPDWRSSESFCEAEPDLSAYSAHAGAVVPLDSAGRFFVAGPATESEGMHEVYRFEEIWRLENTGGEPESIFRAMRSADEGFSANLEEVVLESGFVTRLGKYRLAEVVGSGGMGRVWRAQDAYGNTVAIKTLHTSSAESPDAIRRFRREAEIMSRIPHRNICRIFETGEHDGVHFLAMEFVEGLTLSEILNTDAASTLSRSGNSNDLTKIIAAVRKNKSSIAQTSQDGAEAEEKEDESKENQSPGLILPVEQAVGLIEKVCDAVEFAHEHGVLHRDLKPGNILLRADGEPLVADFGLAKLAGDSDGDMSLSISGNVVGTVENMAPEQAESSKTVDARADVYSLGTILYQMCTGRKHFQATGNFLADLQALHAHEPKRPRLLNSSIDPDLEVIILKCLRAVPDERYRSVSALLADLQRFRRGEPIAARPVTAIDLAKKLVRRNRTVALVAGSSLVLILLLVAGFIWGLTDRLAKEEIARAESERLRVLAEQKEQEAIRSAEEAAELAQLANERLEAVTAAELLAAEREKETTAEKTKREEIEAARAKEQAEFQANLDRLNEQISRNVAPVGKALTASLLEPVTIPIKLKQGIGSGKTTLAPGTSFAVLNEEAERIRVSTAFGEQWIAKTKVEIEREAVPVANLAPTPVPKIAEPVSKENPTLDLTTGDSNRRTRIPREGIFYQASGANGVNVFFLIKEFNADRMVYEWRAPLEGSKQGTGGTGILDIKGGQTVIEAGPAKIAFNNKTPPRLEYHPDKGLLNRAEPEAVRGIPWAEPLLNPTTPEQTALPTAVSTPGATPPAEPIPRWSFVLLEKPLHVGDGIQPDFKVPEPEERQFQAEFDLEADPSQGISAIIRVAHIVPRDHPSFEAGHYSTKLLLNGKEVEVVNNRISGSKDSMEIQTITVPVPPEFLRKGRNTLVIEPGVQTQNMDDFELHYISIGTESATAQKEPEAAAPLSVQQLWELDIDLNGSQVPVTRLGAGPIGVVFFGTSAAAQMNQALISSPNDFEVLLKDKCSLFFLEYPQSASFNQIQPAIQSYLEGDSKKLRPDFSGFASGLVEKLRGKTGISEWLLVGNSLGAGVILWDYEKLAEDPKTSFLLISPTETFMPDPSKLPRLQRTMLLAAKEKGSRDSELGPDPFLRGEKAREWVAENLDVDTVSSLPGFESGHKIIGGDLDNQTLSTILQKKLGL